LVNSLLDVFNWVNAFVIDMFWDAIAVFVGVAAGISKGSVIVPLQRVAVTIAGFADAVVLVVFTVIVAKLVPLVGVAYLFLGAFKSVCLQRPTHIEVIMYNSVLFNRAHSISEAT